MIGDEDELTYALDTLGMSPDEITALADHARREAAVWDELSKLERKDREKRAAIAEWWQRRYRKWKELSALAEQELSDHEFPS